jgi:hypothetical protein
MADLIYEFLFFLNRILNVYQKFACSYCRSKNIKFQNSDWFVISASSYCFLESKVIRGPRHKYENSQRILRRKSWNKPVCIPRGIIILANAQTSSCMYAGYHQIHITIINWVWYSSAKLVSYSLIYTAFCHYQIICEI